MTVDEAAALKSCHRKTILRAIGDGRLGCQRGPHGVYVLDQAEVEALEVRDGGRPRKVSDREAWRQLLGDWLAADDALGEHLRNTIAHPRFDPALFRYLRFHRLQLQGRSRRQAMVEIGATEEVLELLPSLDDLDSTLRRQVQERQDRGLGAPRVSEMDFEHRPGPKPMDPPALTPEEEAHTWSLLAQDDGHDEESLTCIELASEGRLLAELPSVVHVRRLQLHGLGATETALYLRRDLRWVQRLRQAPLEEYQAALRIAARRHKAEPARQRELERGRRERREVRGFRGYDDWADENALPEDPMVESLDALLERRRHPDADNQRYNDDSEAFEQFDDYEGIWEER